MIQQQIYHHDAFYKYLMHIAKHPWKSDAERLDSYANYYIILYKKTHKHWTIKQIQTIWDKYRLVLQQEHDQFIEKFDKVKAQIDKQDEQYAKDRRLVRLSLFEAIALDNKIEPSKIQQIKDLVNNGTISDDRLDDIILEYKSTLNNNRSIDKDLLEDQSINDKFDDINLNDDNLSSLNN